MVGSWRSVVCLRRKPMILDRLRTQALVFVTSLGVAAILIVAVILTVTVMWSQLGTQMPCV